MKLYLECANNKAMKIYEKMKKLRDDEIAKCGENAELFTEVIGELSYRIAEEPDFGEKRLCPKCESPIPKESYNNFCGFCGQFIKK